MTSRALAVFAFLLLALGVQGCAKSHGADDCGEGGRYSEDSVARYCAYVVVKGGFQCPEAFSHRIDIGEGAVCSSVEVELPDLPESVCRNFDDVCGSVELDGGGVDGGDGNGDGFICRTSRIDTPASVRAFDQSSFCDVSALETGPTVHLNGVSVPPLNDNRLDLRFDFHTCPARDQSCHCELVVEFQVEFYAVVEDSPLFSMSNTDVTLAYGTTSDGGDYVQMYSATTIRQTLLFAHHRNVVRPGATTTSQLPSSALAVFNGAALSASVIPNRTVGTCALAYDEGPGLAMKTKVSFLSEIDPPMVVRSIDIAQTGVIEGDGGDTFRIWVQESARLPNDLGGSPNYVHAWSVFPE